MHTTTMRRVLAAVAVLAFVATAAACSSDDDSTGGHGERHDASTTETSEQALPADVNDADVAFVQGMIPHHRQAVDMSELVIKGGSDPETIALAEQIEAAQDPEIDQMSQWLDDWGVTADDGESGEHGMHDDGTSMMEGAGMMTDEEMDDMASMSGADLETMFLQMMIRHHRGAIEMARTELDEGANPDVLALAQTIIDTQQAEIDRMNSMLTTS